MNELKQAFIEVHNYWLAHYPMGQDKPRKDLQTGINLLMELNNPIQPPARTLPVINRYLPSAVEKITTPEFVPFTRLIQRIDSHLCWGVRPASYIGETFTQNYGFFPLAGPSYVDKILAFYPSQKVYAGVSILAPHTLYPRHRHKAVEFYGVLSGSALLQQGDGEWHRMESGSLVHNDSDVIHAIQTQDEPLMTTFIWIGDLVTPIDTDC
ncbi:MAG: dimethylsulfonioproprionate lyase family protein [Chloroflexota bacterium]